jgi:undecaprenyl-diphosphatase
MTIVEAIIVAVVEGLTEFLPISSTGHMIITEHLLHLGQTEEEKSFVKLFTVAIQLGAILAVVVLYWRKFFEFTRWQFYVKLLIGVLPALALGFFFEEKIDEWLFNPLVVAISMLAGGLVLVVIDNVFKHHPVDTEPKISYLNAFFIGCWQVLAMIPGVSRSAASIIGGMQQKLTRNLAAEFSFFLAVPTMFAASAYTLFLKDWSIGGSGTAKGIELVTSKGGNLAAFIVGNLVAFVVAMLAIKFFIGFLQRHGFRVFGVYRIIAGLVLLALIYFGKL